LIELVPVLRGIGDAHWRVRGQAVRDHFIGLLAGQRPQDRAPGGAGRQRIRLVELDHVADPLRALDLVLEDDLVTTPNGQVRGLVEPVSERLQQRPGSPPQRVALPHRGRHREHRGPDRERPAVISLLHPAEAFELTEDPAHRGTVDPGGPLRLTHADAALLAADQLQQSRHPVGDARRRGLALGLVHAPDDIGPE
jgi:hypothetical protein